MKKILIFTFFLSTINSLFSQNLTFYEILELKGKNFKNAQIYLFDKGWGLDKVIEEETDQRLATVLFSKKSTNNISRTFLILGGSEYDSNYPTIIQLSTADKELSREYIMSILNYDQYGFKLIKSDIKNNKLVKVYKNQTYTIEINSDEIITIVTN